MKKILAMMLTAAMMLSMSAAVMAEEKTYTDVSAVTLTKEYKLTTLGTTSPAETFNFTDFTCTAVENAGVGVTTANAPLPYIEEGVSYEAGEAGSANAKKDITITLPEYTAVGKYTYTFNEVDGNTAGVTYRADAIKLVVTVIEQNGKVRVATVHTEGANDSEKSSEFDNEYSAGSLAVSKTVTGILGDKEKYFKVTVTFTAPQGDTVKSDIDISGGSAHVHNKECYLICDSEEDEHEHNEDCYGEELTCGITEANPVEIEAGWNGSEVVVIYVKDGDTITFDNIPTGVTYTVVEDSYTSEGYDAAEYDYSDNEATTTGKGTISLTENEDGTKAADADTVAITNNKDGDVDTGISVDSIPYIAMLGVVAVGGAGFMVSKKRRSED